MNEAEEAQARQRFMLINLVRLGGVVLVLVGIAIARGQLGLPAPIGWVLAVAGLGEFFFLPSVLAKRWRSGEQ